MLCENRTTESGKKKVDLIHTFTIKQSYANKCKQHYIKWLRTVASKYIYERK